MNGFSEERLAVLDAIDDKFDHMNGRFDQLESKIANGNGNGSRRKALLQVGAPASVGTLGLGAAILYIFEKLAGG